MTAQHHPRTWFITGASRGFGRVWAEAALQRGDQVVATARDMASLDELVNRYPQQAMAIEMDVVDRAAVFDGVERAIERFGRLDVVVGNAGFGIFGAIEEVTEADARRQIEVNVFGVVWLLQAVAPVLRAQHGGHLLLTSSFGGLMSFPTGGLYGASKYAVEGLGDSFAQEMADFGVKVTLIEPGAYATDFNGSASEMADPIDAYDAARAKTGAVFSEMPFGDPLHTADAVLDLVDMSKPPLRLLLGAHALPLVLDTYESRVREWQTHAALAERAQ